MSKIQLDDLMESALSSTQRPSLELNEKTKRSMRENVNMGKRARFSVRLALTVAVCLMISCGVVFAAYQYLSPQEVAQKFDHPKLAKAFASKDALRLDQTISSGGYDVTLLGLVFGKELTGVSDQIVKEETYAVVAIEKNGSKMPATSSDEYGGENDFFVSPLVRGYQPWQLNIFRMRGGSISATVDGVLYRLIACDSVEMFADTEVYLGVSNNNGSFCNNESFIFDKDTGEIKGNEENGFTSVVFALPLDKTKADPVKAEKFLQELNLPNESDTEEGEIIIDEDAGFLQAE